MFRYVHLKPSLLISLFLAHFAVPFWWRLCRLSAHFAAALLSRISLPFCCISWRANACVCVSVCERERVWLCACCIVCISNWIPLKFQFLCVPLGRFLSASLSLFGKCSALSLTLFPTPPGLRVLAFLLCSLVFLVVAGALCICCFFFLLFFPPLCCFPIAVAALLLLLFLFLLASMHFSIMIERHLSLVLLFWFGLVSFCCSSTDIFERLDVCVP